MLKATLAVTGMNLRNLPSRWVPSLVALTGVAGVVLVLVATLAINAGFRSALDQAGADDIAVVTRGGSDSELSSGLTGPEATVIMDAPAIARAEGRALASPELYVVVDLPLQGRGTPANVPFRGVGDLAPSLRSHFRLAAGRMFRPGLFELIVGRGAAAGFRGLEVGSTVRLGSLDWEVVGLFEDGGSVAESELWTDVHVLQGAYRRGNSYQSLRLKLPRPASLEALKGELGADPRLNVSVRSEKEFYAAQSRVLIVLVTSLGGAIAFLMGIGAVFGALNTMYSAVAARSREIATLRALGFGGAEVVVSVLAEAMLLALAGGVLGGLVAYLALNGYRATTLNFQTFSQLAFAFAVTPGVLVTGISYALALGLLGGIAPGLRAASAPIPTGLHT
jgi:putative ABC transport system permease protein